MKERLKEITAADQILIISVLIVATVMRIFNIDQLPFMHDELSALLRAQGENISKVIIAGADEDVHPIGIHLFLHFWQGPAGMNEALIKLPFIAMSLGGIYFIYRIAASWFSPLTGLLTASFMACLQFYVMYGQLARPYASGLFFCSWFIWCWSQLLFSEKGERLKIAGLVISGTLACYNHYFSLLFVALAGITGLFLLNGRTWRRYLLACFYIMLLFVPHIKITLGHLAMGQSDEAWWISRPGADWLVGFFSYLLHFRREMYALFTLLVLGSFIWYNREGSVFSKKRIVCAILGFSSFLIIFFYSRESNPVLQLSSMTFSAPFLLMLAFSFYGDAPLFVKTSMSFAIILLASWSLFTKREHLHTFGKQPYEQMAKISTDMNSRFGKDSVSSIHRIPEGFMQPYFEKYDSFAFERMDAVDYSAFSSWLAEQKGKVLIAGNLPGEYEMMIAEKYPYLFHSTESFTTWIHCYIKDSTMTKDTASFRFSTNWTQRGEGWGATDTIGDLSDREYGPSFQDSVQNMIHDKYDELWASATLERKDTAHDALIVAEIRNGSEQLLWRANSFKPFHAKKGPATMYLSVPLRDLDEKLLMKSELKVYVWNRDKQPLLLKEMSIKVRKGNKYIYGLYEPF